MNKMSLIRCLFGFHMGLWARTILNPIRDLRETRIDRWQKKCFDCGKILETFTTNDTGD